MALFSCVLCRPLQLFQSRLRDAERLQLYSQSTVFYHSELSASLAEAESRSQRWEKEAKESVEKVARAEEERDTARHEASMARMDADAAGSARAKVESKLVRVQNALAIAEEARWKAEDEASRLAVERVSLLLELRTSKDEVSALQAHALKEKKALKEAYEEGFDVIFNYGYDCCAFAHNICGSKPVVPYGMSNTSKPLSPEFFINPHPPGAVSAEVATINVRSGEAMIAPKREVPAAVLETDISEEGEHLSASKGNKPDSSSWSNRGK